MCSHEQLPKIAWATRDTSSSVSGSRCSKMEPDPEGPWRQASLFETSNPHIERYGAWCPILARVCVALLTTREVVPELRLEGSLTHLHWLVVSGEVFG